MYTKKALEDLKPEKEFFVGIDSDGCAFPTMELKHKECFIPNIVKYWKFQPISKYAREAAEFVNLYSKWRGVNRFPALLKVFDLLKERPEVQRSIVTIPEAKPLRDWVARETALGNPTLIREVEKTHDPVLIQALEWSEAVNATIADMVKGVPPFPGVKESLKKLKGKADVIVVSATPGEALEREWKEHGIDTYVRIIAGQEMGTKREHLQLAASGKYPKVKILMVGDAPGDMKSAKAIDALFFPINPGHEEESWVRFLNEGIDKFLNGEYAGDYERERIEDFEKLLPETPPWKRG